MATSKLQIYTGDMLDKTFPEYHIKENYRPDWLMSSNITKLELDFYIEELKIGFEVQGIQHFEFTPYFHKDIADFEKRKQYDKEKNDLCEFYGVQLIEIFSTMDAVVEIKTLREVIDCKENNDVLKIIPESDNIQKAFRLANKTNVNISYYEYKELEKKFNRTSNELQEYKNKHKNLIIESENKIKEEFELKTPQEKMICELNKWNRKALKNIGKRCEFISEFIPPETIIKLSDMLKCCATKEEINTAFSHISS
jgi:hypothetical protein